MIRAVALFVLFLPVAWLGQLLAYPLAPVAAWLADDEGRLPVWLQWMETHDNLGWDGPMTEPATAKHGRASRVGLMFWLWRNKAYTLRYWMRVDASRVSHMRQYGSPVVPWIGFNYWAGVMYANGRVWFEVRPRLGFGKSGYVYLRIGWKIRPYFDKLPKPGDKLTSAGMFAGISPRTSGR